MNQIPMRSLESIERGRNSIVLECDLWHRKILEVYLFKIMTSDESIDPMCF